MQIYKGKGKVHRYIAMAAYPYFMRLGNLPSMTHVEKNKTKEKKEKKAA